MSERLQYRKSIAGTYDFRLEGGHCVANCAVGKDWLTIYTIATDPGFRGRGECQRLIEELKKRCKNTGRKLQCWCPLSDVMRHILEKTDVEEV